VKAILPTGWRFAARAITRDPNSDKARELARLGARWWRRRRRRGKPEEGVRGRVRRLLRDLLLGPYVRRKEKVEARPWHGREGGRREARIWSTLEDSRKWIPSATTGCPR